MWALQRFVYLFLWTLYLLSLILKLRRVLCVFNDPLVETFAGEINETDKCQSRHRTGTDRVNSDKWELKWQITNSSITPNDNCLRFFSYPSSRQNFNPFSCDNKNTKYGALCIWSIMNCNDSRGRPRNIKFITIHHQNYFYRDIELNRARITVSYN